MPLYDYRCEECHAKFEVRATIQEKGAGLKPECPKCHSRKTRQMITSGLVMRATTDRGSSAPPCCGPDTKTGCCG